MDQNDKTYYTSSIFRCSLYIFTTFLIEKARNDYKQRGLKPFIYMFLVYIAVYIFIESIIK